MFIRDNVMVSDNGLVTGIQNTTCVYKSKILALVLYKVSNILRIPGVKWGRRASYFTLRLYFTQLIIFR